MIGKKENTQLQQFTFGFGTEDFFLDLDKKSGNCSSSGNCFFYWDIIYFNTDLHNEDNGGIGSAKAVFCQTREFRRVIHLHLADNES